MDFQFFQYDLKDCAEHFDGIGPIHCARAPGRLDVMGGIADYSGSVVAEKTLEDSTWAAAQLGRTPVLRMRSIEPGWPETDLQAELPLDRLFASGRLTPLAEVRDAFADCRWAAYIGGCVCLLLEDGMIESPPGINILCGSHVPVGAGVSSSAALEVACMRAICSLLAIELDGMRLARLCQRVENEIVGAPCGIMDQVTSALGQESSLLALECRPHNILGHIRIPERWQFIGLNSKVKHSVGGSAYTHARVGAFMGLAILRKLIPERGLQYLCELTPGDWSAVRDRVPVELTGAAFMAENNALPDSVTTVDPQATYYVRDCTEHPILENARVLRFLELIQSDEGPAKRRMIEAGKLMLESHASYSERVRLGSPETDLLVNLAMEFGPEKGIYGAKITGGGSGGTVALLCESRGMGRKIAHISVAYHSHTGNLSRQFSGSSPGAMHSHRIVIDSL